MAASDERIRSWLDGLLERTQAQLRDELNGLVSKLTEELAERRAEAAREARREAEAAGAAFVAEALRVEREAAEQRLNAAVAAARAELAAEHERVLANLRAAVESSAAAASAPAAEREAALATASDLLDAIRALDAAPALSSVLDELAAAAARFTARTAVLLHRDGRLYGWAWHGFPESAGQARDYSASLVEAGVAGLAVLAGEPRSGAGRDTRGVLGVTGSNRVAFAVPVRAGRDVVAVLYADNEDDGAGGGGKGTPAVPAAWPELIETLARHAGRCLESVIVAALPELIRAGATEQARRRALTTDEEAARRYARLLVAEIKLYHEALVDEARRERSLLRRLRPQIERAQQLYEQRVAPAVRERTRYFEQELVRTLADGDPSLLGRPS